MDCQLSYFSLILLASGVLKEKFPHVHCILNRGNIYQYCANDSLCFDTKIDMDGFIEWVVWDKGMYSSCDYIYGILIFWFWIFLSKWLLYRKQRTRIEILGRSWRYTVFYEPSQAEIEEESVNTDSVWQGHQFISMLLAMGLSLWNQCNCGLSTFNVLFNEIM